jgi:hypothetical protein
LKLVAAASQAVRPALRPRVQLVAAPSQAV